MLQLKGKDPKHNKRVQEVSFETAINSDVIEKVLDLLCEYKVNKINKIELPKDKILTKEEFEETMPIFKIPHFGYLKPNYYKYRMLGKKNYNNLNKKK